MEDMLCDYANNDDNNDRQIAQTTTFQLNIPL
jgi:hypothetical protein